DGEGNLGRPLTVRQVRAGGDDARLVGVGAGDNEGEAGARVGAVAQGRDQLRARGRHGEESPPPRLGREAFEEGGEGVAVFRPGRAHVGGAPVAQDEPAGFGRVLVRGRNKAGADGGLHWVPFGPEPFVINAPLYRSSAAPGNTRGRMRPFYG